MSDVILAPCPFCGSEAYDDKATWRVFGKRTGHEYAVACRYCEASSPGDDDLRLAITAWNRRALPAAQPAPVTVEEAARVLLDWWNSCEVSNPKRIVSACNALRENDGDAWAQFDTALRAVAGEKS